MLRHQYVDLFEDLFGVRDAKWKNEEKNMNISALFLFLPINMAFTNLSITPSFSSIAYIIVLLNSLIFVLLL